MLVGGGPASAMADRARAFASRLGCDWRVETVYRDGSRAHARRTMQRALRDLRPDVVYVVDLTFSNVVAAAVHGLRTRTPFVVDTGDAITALARQSGRRQPALAATALVENLGLRRAAGIVVRGTFHRALLRQRGLDATVVPDGVDTALFKPGDRDAARAGLGWPPGFVVTIIGSSIWNPRLRMTYGWDLVEALALTRGSSIRGVLVGDGDGIDHLRARARELGVADRMTFAGRQPLTALPPIINASDVCLSTQSADTVGEVRTTGKLPLYMASGAYVLATAVGEAKRVLPDEMLIEYEGSRDESYPGRLAGRLLSLAADPSRLARGVENVDVARREFDYDLLAPRVGAVLADAAGSRPS